MPACFNDLLPNRVPFDFVPAADHEVLDRGLLVLGNWASGHHVRLEQVVADILPLGHFGCKARLPE